MMRTVKVKDLFNSISEFAHDTAYRIYSELHTYTYGLEGAPFGFVPFGGIPIEYSKLSKLADGYHVVAYGLCTEEIPLFNLYLIVPNIIINDEDIKNSFVGFYIKGFDELPDVDEYLKSIDSGVISETDYMRFSEAKLFDVREENNRLCAYPYLGVAFDYNENGQPYMCISAQGK